MKVLFKCAKISQSLQHNIRPLFALGLLYFYSKVNVFNLSVTKKKPENKLHLLC